MNLFDLQLDPLATGFSVRNARGLAWVSAQAYESATFGNAPTDTQVLFIEKPDYAVLAFRGTSSVRDWMTDVNFDYEHIPNSAHANLAVHDGFYDALDSVFEQCALAVSRIGGKPLFITGHSLGGALAQLFAFLIARQTNSPIIAGVYTFGSPRVGNKAFAAAYNNLLKAATFNLVNACDPVPLLPPLLAGYRDGGTEIFMPAAGGFVADPFIGTELGNDLLGMFWAWRKGRLAFLPNHFINRYEEKITAL